MVNGLSWRIVPDEEAARSWDGWLSEFSDAHVKQTSAWARHKTGGWTPVFTGLFNGPTPLALGLVLERAAPLGSLRVGWSNGGPCFRKKRPESQDYAALGGWLDGARERTLAKKRALLRVNLEVPASAETAMCLREGGFLPARTPLSTGLSFALDLTRSPEELRAGFARNWRNQLKQAEGKGPKLDWGREPALADRYAKLHEAMCARKGLEALRQDPASLRAHAAALGDNFVWAVASVDGRDGAGGAFWRLGHKAWFAFFAADEHGNSLNLPNAMLAMSLERLRAEGCTWLDLTGSDPGANKGVHHFKRGTGAAPLMFAGEWEYAASPATRLAFDAALAAMRDRLA